MCYVSYVVCLNFATLVFSMFIPSIPKLTWCMVLWVGFDFDRVPSRPQARPELQHHSPFIVLPVSVGQQIHPLLPMWVLSATWLISTLVSHLSSEMNPGCLRFFCWELPNYIKILYRVYFLAIIRIPIGGWSFCFRVGLLTPSTFVPRSTTSCRWTYLSRNTKSFLPMANWVDASQMTIVSRQRFF